MSPGSDDDPDSAGSGRRLYLAVELAILFVAFPIGLVFVRDAFARLIVPTLLVTGGACFFLLWRDPGFDRRRLWNARGFRAGLLRRLRVFVPGAIAIGLAVAIWKPDLLFGFPRREPEWWLVVMVLYPLLSVYPQEVIFRSFFFHRYRELFPSSEGLVWGSALVFGLAHLFFGNWVAPTLTAIGGYLFARTYQQSESTLQAVVEHGLWGDFLFTIGLGWYFWGGSIRAMAGG